MTFQKLNQKGIFITLTALLLVLMLILSSYNSQKVRLIEEDSTNLAISAERNYFTKTNLLDATKSIYSNSGINWEIKDNNLIYSETFPDTNSKNKIPVNMGLLKSFFIQEFPTNVSFKPESVDLGEIIVYGQDLNIKHSQSTGFGNNKLIFFKFSPRQFNTMQYDLNINANTVQIQSQSFPLCSSCANPVRLVLNIKNSSGSSILSFNNIIDYSQNGSLDLNTSGPTPDFQFRYTPTDVNLTVNTSQVSMNSKFTFNNPLMQVNLNNSMILVSDKGYFGLEG